MRELEPEQWLELGPGSVLAGLLKRFDRELPSTSIGDPEQVDAFLNGRSG